MILAVLCQGVFMIPFQLMGHIMIYNFFLFFGLDL